MKTIIIFRSVLAMESGIQEAPMEPGESSVVQFYTQAPPAGAVLWQVAAMFFPESLSAPDGASCL